MTVAGRSAERSHPAVADAPGAADSTPAKSWPQVPWLATVLIAAQSMAMYLAARRGSFLADDWLNLLAAHHRGISIAYLEGNVFGHFFPAYRLAFMQIEHRLGVHYEQIVVGVVAIYGLGLLAMYRIAVQILGRTPWTLLLVCSFGFSAVWAMPIFWLSAALNVIVTNTLMLFAVDAFLRYRRSGSRVQAMVVVACFMVALLFYEKALLLGVYLVILSATVLTPRWRLRDAAASVLRSWPLWLALAIPATLFLTVYVGGGYYRTEVARPIHPSGVQLAHFLAIAWFVAFVPAVVGGPLQWDFGFGLGAPSPPWPLVAAAQVALAAVFVASVVMDRRALRGWVFVVLTFVVGQLTVAWGRYPLRGLGPARNYQYQADMYFLLFIGLAFAFAPIGMRHPPSTSPAPSGSAIAATRGQTPARRAWQVGGTCLACTAVMLSTGLYAVSLRRASDNWATIPTRPFIAELRSSLATLGPAVGPIRVAQRTLPPALAPYFWGLDASLVLPMIDGRLQVVSAPLAQYVLGDDGELRPARLG